MGTTIKIQETDIDIVGLECSQCYQPITEQDKYDNNFTLHYDTTNEIDFVPSGEKYKLTVYVREITHGVETYECERESRMTYLTGKNKGKPYVFKEKKEYFNCPDTETCENCSERKLVEKMLQTPFNKETVEGGDYFCDKVCQKEFENRKPKTVWEYCVDKVIQEKK